SGGEKGRVILIKLLLNKANFLILDEPTNHLDIQSKEVLEDALYDFPGTILFISHDRYFINKLATKIVALDQHGASTIMGNYDDYLAIRPQKGSNTKDNSDYLNTKKQLSQDRKLKNKIKKLEDDIAKLDDLISRRQEELTTEEVINDYVRYNALVEEIEDLNLEQETLMEEWMMLQ
ncbi:MAG: ABC-F family ATP-binding cassette domain-containing protein, partial [Erysipelotrichaceae bacterium]|nr:ABC-F family ATP-binding cassette domain-containing protein [Erysipelotrichaceae bacterium]